MGEKGIFEFFFSLLLQGHRCWATVKDTNLTEPVCVEFWFVFPRFGQQSHIDEILANLSLSQGYERSPSKQAGEGCCLLSLLERQWTLSHVGPSNSTSVLTCFLLIGAIGLSEIAMVLWLGSVLSWAKRRMLTGFFCEPWFVPESPEIPLQALLGR